jgi:hypothetical protein
MSNRWLIAIGVAGGEKFICRGILFKFSLDTMIGTDRYLYGGEVRSDEKAMKSACNERKGYIIVFSKLS